MNPEDNRVLASFAPHRGKLLVTFLGLVMFTAAGAYVLLAVEPEQIRAALGVGEFGRLALWAVLVLCPVFAVDALARIMRRTPNVVATGEGLAFRSIAGFSEPIPWREISGVRAVFISKKPYLAIYIDDPNGVFGRMGTWTRLMHAKSHAAGVPNITLRAIQLGVSPAEAAEVLEGIRENFQAP
jgi:hypothetical protein